MKHRRPAAPLRYALFALLLAPSLCGALTIKLGSVAPVGSPWDTALRAMAADWSRITGGQVELKVYLGGVAGDEPDMVRKIRIGQLQAAALTSLALNQISPDVLVLSSPFLIDNDGELDYVLARTKSVFVGDIESKGFRVLALSKAGWVRFFSSKPIVVPDDLKKQRLAVNVGDADLLATWRGLGFDAVPLGMTDTTVGLQNGMVGATYGTPLLAAGYQWFGPAPYMSSLRVAPVLGGMLVSARTWAQVPEQFRAPMLAAVEKADRWLYEQTVKLDAEALAVMQRNGLTVVDTPADAERLWRSEMVRGFELAVSKTFSREIYDRVTGLLKEYRALRAPGGATPGAR
jgi:TRAP-type transport system periplasmic protein